jgi:hypothetical protein
LGHNGVDASKGKLTASKEGMMREDRRRWDKRYQGRPEPGEPSRLVTEFVGLAPFGTALDIAAGQGRNALLPITLKP